MSIRVTDFKWEKGKNDLEYIALLKENLDAMTYKFKECAKVAKEQYNKGRESAFKEIAYSEELGLTKESEYEKRIRADERAKVLMPYDVESIEELIENVRAKAIDECIDTLYEVTPQTIDEKLDMVFVNALKRLKEQK